MNKQMQILLVEDHLADARLVEEALVDCNAPIALQRVKDGVEAVEFLRCQGTQDCAKKPDLIILDLNMPRKDGHEFLSEMKEYLDECEIPVVLLTVSDRAEDLERAMNKKLNFYLNKPVNADKLRRIVGAVNELWRSAS
ncbi:MAG: response regulator [Candidatus Obscuribacterales bacterium]|nr:response regulator [Candidatus Obscuribacterales bacterium]